jgi:hypothetical protein
MLLPPGGVDAPHRQITYLTPGALYPIGSPQPPHPTPNAPLLKSKSFYKYTTNYELGFIQPSKAIIIINLKSYFFPFYPIGFEAIFIFYM